MNDRWTWHGGGLTAAKARFAPRADAAWIDLSTGINPRPWPGAGDCATDWHRLPDEQGMRDLEAAAAAHYGADPDQVCALPGTEIGLRLLGLLLPGEAHVPHPTYRTHGEMFARSRQVPWHGLAEVEGGTLVIANPNNPDGHLHSRAQLRALLARRGAEGWLVVDEAFADCHPAHAIAPEVDDGRRLIVLRSFGKFFGLAGVRLGFLVAPRPIVAAMRNMLGAWPVSAAAIAIGTAACRDAAWITATRARLTRDRAALDALLRARGLPPRGECPLFRLVETGDAHALFRRLASHGILTRPFDYDATWLRIGLTADRAELRRLDEALRDD
ncbi:threonine-phosphate decarboxylase [Novosphingobium sp. PC22D]|uniref:threonine-phosphate decarboxylase CobD n=1 Tax=Novosphingobium sp. PC22D TaxID=1962403 RepID=UPI000BF1ECEE|nr:threonine-phosphate decarboxylase CobD [Novosphingobium sp. PC22D]PEQ13672.1 threonine-phosphate decarboxylase [Novosphingobium sp. PC22D]